MTEYCNGLSPDCPADGVASSSLVCAQPPSPCYLASYCTGMSPNCPNNPYAPTTTQCGAPRTCTNATLTTAARCNGAGTCVDGQQQSCAPYSCDTSTQSCRTTCQSQTDCAQGAYCNGAHCAPKVANGGMCQQNEACVSGACIDNRCCAGNCGQYTCDTGGTCATSCSPTACSTSQCRIGATCANDGTCGAPLAPGQPCQVGCQCASGQCADWYPDLDGDGYTDSASVRRCSAQGGGPPPNHHSGATSSADCCDSDGNARPFQSSYFSTPRVGCGGFDYDCTSGEQQRWTAVRPCDNGQCGSGGWLVSQLQGPPGCGVSATWVLLCESEEFICNPVCRPVCLVSDVEPRTQECH